MTTTSAFLLLCVLATVAFVSSFTLSMRVKTPSVGNISRKLKRKIRSVDATTFTTLYTPEFDEYLKTEATTGIYDSIFKQLTKKARELKVTVKSEFGFKPKAVIPNIAETATAAGTFNVCSLCTKIFYQPYLNKCCNCNNSCVLINFLVISIRLYWLQSMLLVLVVLYLVPIN